MLVYHGSDRNFRNFRISKSLVNRVSTQTNEGLGIYFSPDINVAKAYGKYVYSAYVNDTYLLDFRYKTVCTTYINSLCFEIYRRTKVNIHDFINTSMVANYMYMGGLSIYGAGIEVYRMLDNCSMWYSSLSTSVRNEVKRICYSYGKTHLKAYLFNYHIKNIGVIKVISDDVVQIMDKMQSAYL